ncbi:MAG TPA: hypothetical protein VM142_10660 [Acidimicrobiales bacterium]|nr:hypothetical protein [Acidimicrobiales bacterium]
MREGIGWFLFLVRWIWRTYPTKRRPAILKAVAERGGGAQVFWLRTRGEMRSFLDSLERST